MLFRRRFWVSVLAIASRALAACSNDTAVVRKEWNELSDSERLAYIDGIKCLQERPSRLSDTCPACKSAYDDFTAVHINQTRSIHLSGIFYSWHRHYVSLMEQRLHQECNYPAGLGIPYWNWALPEYQGGLENSSLFSGSATSMSGNGSPSAPRGRGCVTAGPFVNMTARFGPFTLLHLFGALPSNWTAPNPRCLQRSLNDNLLRTLNSPERLAAALAAPTVQAFQMATDVITLGGFHVGGHNAVGDTLRDIFCSPQDPVFFLHHAMMDRVWAAWQAGDPPARRRAYFGTSTVGNRADTPPVTDETLLSFGVLGEDVRVGEVADPMGGMYCYRYT
jgi:tyrosinase